MKLSKSDLKAIVKECLVEILNEGLSGSGEIGNKSMQVTRPPFVENSRLLPRRSVAIDEMKKQAPQQRSVATPQLKEAIRSAAGGNKVMESILADTAASTLPQMLRSDSVSNNSAEARSVGVEQINASPEEIFGEDVSSKWAALAFSETPLKK